jgi:hypothetical protein
MSPGEINSPRLSVVLLSQFATESERYQRWIACEILPPLRDLHRHPMTAAMTPIANGVTSV